MKRQKITKIGELDEYRFSVGFEFEGGLQEDLYHTDLVDLKVTKGHGAQMSTFTTELKIAGWGLDELQNVYFWYIGCRGYRGVFFKDLDYIQDLDYIVPKELSL